MRKLVMAIVTVVSTLAFGGCATDRGGGAGDSRVSTKPGGRPIEVRPEWVEFVRMTYRDRVTAAVKTPGTVVFTDEPKVRAGYDAGRDVTTLAGVGSVDAQNAYGAMIRNWYVVTWQAPGDASKQTWVAVWVPKTAYVSPGQLPK